MNLKIAKSRALALAMLIMAWASFLFSAAAEQRFPPPEFESGHQLPVTQMPAARALLYQYLDVVVLGASLAVATWLVYRKRSRKGLIWLSLFSVLYFGFWRKGCVCSIGSLQNVALALADHSYVLPAGVLAFFLLPLAFALFGGRTFCASVCPHGALQDLVLLKPIKVSSWLEQGLSLLPYIYLGAGVLFAATGSAFIICQYDPFVPIFRMNGRILMVLAGAGLLVLGIFVGRPYCRFLCPYGALLRLAGLVSKWRVRVTPNYCTQCRLCEGACPFGAMREPTPSETNSRVLGQERKRLGWLVVALPLLMAAAGWLGWKFSGPAATLHPTVSLASQFLQQQDAPSKSGPLSAADLALERTRQTPQEILAEAVRIQKQFALGGWLFGAWVGLVLGLKLIGLSVRQERTDFEPDRGACFACARCFEYCPNELVRRGLAPANRGELAGLAAPCASTSLPGS